jgi:hypothetical protein
MSETRADGQAGREQSDEPLVLLRGLAAAATEP